MEVLEREVDLEEGNTKKVINIISDCKIKKEDYSHLSEKIKNKTERYPVSL
jgi:hypothetical protein